MDKGYCGKKEIKKGVMMSLISLKKSTIDKMNRASLFRAIGKAEFASVYTDKTWKMLNKRLSKVL